MKGRRSRVPIETATLAVGKNSLKDSPDVSFMKKNFNKFTKKVFRKIHKQTDL